MIMDTQDTRRPIINEDKLVVRSPLLLHHHFLLAINLTDDSLRSKAGPLCAAAADQKEIGADQEKMTQPPKSSSRQ